VGMRIRLGPFSVSSRGRVGVRVGPVSAYGGGRRGSSGSEWGEWGVLIGAFTAVAVVVFVVIWLLSLFGHAIGFTPSWHQLKHRDKAWSICITPSSVLGTSALLPS
jgi:hypothetical protein